MNHIRIEDNPFDIVMKFFLFLFLSLAELVRGWIVCSRLLHDPDASVPAISEEDDSHRFQVLRNSLQSSAGIYRISTRTLGD